MSGVPLSIPNSVSWPQPRDDKAGCWPCRFRKKACKPGSSGPQPCRDCATFNIVCCGQGLDRPSGFDVAEQIRALTKEWIGNRSNRGPSVAPLDLTRFILAPSSSPVVNSANLQHSDGTPSLFSQVEAYNSQKRIIAGSAPSHNHEDTIYPLDTKASWNDTQSSLHIHDHKRQTQPPPPPTTSWIKHLSGCFPIPICICIFGFTWGSTDHVPSASPHDENVLSSSSPGLYDPLSALGRPSSETFVTGKQLQAPYGPTDGMRLPWDSYPVYR